MRQSRDRDLTEHLNGFTTPEARVQAKAKLAEVLPPASSQPDEVLIADARAGLRPAQVVEHKLISLLKSVYLPVSHVRTTSLCTGRAHFSAPPTKPDPTVRQG